jgi:hypothetical protein
MDPSSSDSSTYNSDNDYRYDTCDNYVHPDKIRENYKKLFASKEWQNAITSLKIELQKKKSGKIQNKIRSTEPYPTTTANMNKETIGTLYRKSLKRT